MNKSDIATLINANLLFFAIENHQGVPGPDALPPVSVTTDDVDEDACILSIDDIEEFAWKCCKAIESAFFDRGDTTDLSLTWVYSCGCYEAGFGPIAADFLAAKGGVR